MIYAVTAGVTAPGAWFFSTAAYSGAAVLLSTLHAWSPPLRGDGPVNSRAGCKRCAK